MSGWVEICITVYTSHSAANKLGWNQRVVLSRTLNRLKHESQWISPSCYVFKCIVRPSPIQQTRRVGIKNSLSTHITQVENLFAARFAVPQHTTRDGQYIPIQQEIDMGGKYRYISMPHHIICWYIGTAQYIPYRWSIDTPVWTGKTNFDL